MYCAWFVNQSAHELPSQYICCTITDHFSYKKVHISCIIETIHQPMWPYDFHSFFSSTINPSKEQQLSSMGRRTCTRILHIQKAISSWKTIMSLFKIYVQAPIHCWIGGKPLPACMYFICFCPYSRNINEIYIYIYIGGKWGQMITWNLIDEISVEIFDVNLGIVPTYQTHPLNSNSFGVHYLICKNLTKPD